MPRRPFYLQFNCGLCGLEKIYMISKPELARGNDPEPLGFGLSQPRLNIFIVGNMEEIICLGQGGLLSLSATSSLSFSLVQKRHNLQSLGRLKPNNISQYIWINTTSG